MKHRFLILLVAIFTSLLACNENEKKQKTTVDTLTKTEAKQTLPDKTYLIKQMKIQSVTLSCGGGCAMSYSARNLAGNANAIKVNFLVDVFENEEMVDNYFENFTFYYKERKLVKIIREGEKESFLETQMPSAQQSFKDFAHEMITAINKDLAKN